MGSLQDVIENIAHRLNGLESQAFWGGIVMWVVLSLAVGVIAQGKGRSASYALLALVLSPLVGILVVLALSDRRAAELAALRARLTAIDGKMDEGPLMPAGGGLHPNVVGGVLIAIIIIVAVIGGISQLGRQANTTFESVSQGMAAPPR